MSMAMIDAHEGRDMMTDNTPNTFVQAPMEQKEGEDCVTMKIARVLVDILLEWNPNECGGHTVHEHGKKALCAMALEATCGMSQAALLWHKKFRKDSESVGHKFNDCDLCTANKKCKGIK